MELLSRWWPLAATVNDKQLQRLLRLDCTAMAALTQEASLAVHGRKPVYVITKNKKRRWHLRQTLPLLCNTLRGLR